MEWGPYYMAISIFPLYVTASYFWISNKLLFEFVTMFFSCNWNFALQFFLLWSTWFSGCLVALIQKVCICLLQHFFVDAFSVSVFERLFLDFKKTLVFMFQTCIVASLKQKFFFRCYKICFGCWILLSAEFLFDLVDLILLALCRMIFFLTPFLNSFGDRVYKISDYSCYPWNLFLCMVCFTEALAGQQYIRPCLLHSGLLVSV